MYSRRYVPLLLALGLVACGGGGGGGGSTIAAPSVTTYTISGSISLPESAAVDSDTGDTLQAAWARNNSLQTAQSINTPIQLAGYVNRAGQGPQSSAFYATGDIDDYFRVKLTAGQTVMLAIAADGKLDDVDLYLYDVASGVMVGKSSTQAASECVRVTRSSDYYVHLVARSGASLYSLRIGLPGESTGCPNIATGNPLFVTGELVAQMDAQQGLRSVAEARADSSAQRKSVPSSEALQVTGLEPWRNAQWPTQDAGQMLIAQRAQRDFETASYAKTLENSAAYTYAEPNYLLSLEAYVPNDPSYLPQRWHYEQISQPAALERILAFAPTSQRPIVAVVDTGLITDHPDFTDQQVAGMSFINGVASVGGDDPSTPGNSANGMWHGSHVAGTVAARDDNAQFGAGVARFAQIMPIRVFDPNSGFTTSFDVTQAIRFAARLSNVSGNLPARKADVVNLSLGGAGLCPSQLQDTVNQARNAGVIIVAAAGNSARNDLGQTVAVGSPANCDGVIAVGALNAQRQRAWYSQSGARLSVMAPGGDSKVSTTGTGYPDAVYSTMGAFDGAGKRTASFGGMAGTSMASPHVAGVMALMRYVYPAITPGEIDTLIASGELTDDLSVAGRDDVSGYGLINARKAVDRAILLAGGGTVSGLVVATPASIDFGSTLNSATLTLKLTAASSETVTSVTADSSAVTISKTTVSTITGLGDYNISVNRSLLPVGASYPTITVATSTRSFTVQLAVTRLAAGVSSPAASFGTLWVLALRASDWSVLNATAATSVNGKYQWSLGKIPAGDVILVAGSDNDGDFFICDAGEACGSVPGPGEVINISRNTSQLDFSVGLINSGLAGQASVPGAVAPSQVSGYARR